MINNNDRQNIKNDQQNIDKNDRQTFQHFISSFRIPDGGVFYSGVNGIKIFFPSLLTIRVNKPEFVQGSLTEKEGSVQLASLN